MSPKKLTKAEKWSIGLSIVAVVISIAMPFISYFWLDPQLQSFRNRARLQLNSGEIFPNSKPPDPNNLNYPKKTETDFIEIDSSQPWYIEILNVGGMPAKEVQIVFAYPSQSEKQPELIFEPPSANELVQKGNNYIITLKRSIAPQDKVKISTLVVPDEVWVYSEFGESNNIKTNMHLVRRQRRIIEQVMKMLKGFKSSSQQKKNSE